MPSFTSLFFVASRGLTKVNRVQRAASPAELDAALVYSPGDNINVAQIAAMG
jgi:hypothetical protein